MDDSVRRYRVIHETLYEYTVESSLCHNQLHLKPRELPHQRVSHSVIDIHPKPACRFLWQDTFGNDVEFFSIEELHASMTVTSRCQVERNDVPSPRASGLTWKEMAEWFRNASDLESLMAREYLFDSRYCHASPAFSEFAAHALAGSDDALDALLGLNARIYSQFEYMPESTHVTTQPLDVLFKRRGVCQDFAHVLICCFRSMGIPARYVSGYLLTRPAPGQPKLVGADASHAWVSVYAGPLGWIDLDPTNNSIPKEEHITVAWGRDYADVAPIQGVFVGGGCTSLKVSVDVSLADESLPD